MLTGVREVRLSFEPRRLAVPVLLLNRNGTDRGLARVSNYRQKEEARFPYYRLLSAIYRPFFLGLCRAFDLAIVGEAM
jgi:hypothetical protein